MICQSLGALLPEVVEEADWVGIQSSELEAETRAHSMSCP